VIAIFHLATGVGVIGFYSASVFKNVGGPSVDRITARQALLFERLFKQQNGRLWVLWSFELIIDFCDCAKIRSLFEIPESIFDFPSYARCVRECREWANDRDQIEQKDKAKDPEREHEHEQSPNCKLPPTAFAFVAFLPKTSRHARLAVAKPLTACGGSPAVAMFVRTPPHPEGCLNGWLHVLTMQVNEADAGNAYMRRSDRLFAEDGQPPHQAALGGAEIGAGV
jgi:hypothetical protein